MNELRGRMQSLVHCERNTQYCRYIKYMCAYTYTCIHVEEQGNTHKRIGIASTSSCLAGIPNMPDITV